MYLLDSSTVIYFFRGVESVTRNWLAHEDEGLALPSVVLYELLVGAESSRTPERRLTQIQAIMPQLAVLPFGAPEAGEAASIRGDLERRGFPIGPIDTLIAATARANGLPLVTHNLREFERVAGLEVVDWY